MDIKNLSLEEAVIEHRKLWNWIVKYLGWHMRRDSELTMFKIKELYFKKYIQDNLLYARDKEYCFGCMYASQRRARFGENKSKCVYCPFEWPNINCCIETYPNMCYYVMINNIDDAIELGNEIAKVPVKGGLFNGES